MVKLYPHLLINIMKLAFSPKEGSLYGLEIRILSRSTHKVHLLKELREIAMPNSKQDQKTNDNEG